ncbi:MAG: hypothetical protein GX254_05615 [Clostridiales bacterium]|nr:hypothetical protein [Clostridiales bacterium]
MKKFLENELAETVFYMDRLVSAVTHEIKSFGIVCSDHMGSLEERLDMLELSTKIYELLKDNPFYPLRDDLRYIALLERMKSIDHGEA